MRLATRRAEHERTHDGARQRVFAYLAQLERDHGRVWAAIVRGEGCCQINDPEYSREWWQAVAADFEALRAAAAEHEQGHR